MNTEEFWIITFSIELYENSKKDFDKISEIIELTCNNFYRVNKLTYLVKIVSKYEKSPYDKIINQLSAENIYANLLVFKANDWEFWCNCKSKEVFENNKELNEWLKSKE